MKQTFLSAFIVIFFLSNSSGQIRGVTFKSSDTALEHAFAWAKSTALHYRHDSGDPVGPWYDASLPGRSAFCMRDVSHQSIGAEILGMSKENNNMFTKFVTNISKSKDWCSYWEINKWNKPAPVDYRNDKEFWYNLDANFDVLYACWRLYLWTGDKTYISSPAFVNFYEKTLNNYIQAWALEVDSLLTRPLHPDAPVPINPNDPFQSNRGLPSYVESIPNLKMTADLIAAIYQGFVSYSGILKEKGKLNESQYYLKKAKSYKQEFYSKWWNQKKGLYNTYYTTDNKFGMGLGNTFLLWFNILHKTSRVNATLDHLSSIQLNVESTSYLPYIFYEDGRYEQAYKYLLYLSNPNTKRREYPEVSYGVLQGIVLGYMGIEPDACNLTLSTCFRGKHETIAELNSLPILQTTIDLKYNGYKSTTIANTGKSAFFWKAVFPGRHASIYIKSKAVSSKIEYTMNNNVCSFSVIKVKPGERVTAIVK